MRKHQSSQQALQYFKANFIWGHQILSYLLDQSRFKYAVGNTQGILDDDMADCIPANLKQGFNHV